MIEARFFEIFILHHQNKNHQIKLAMRFQIHFFDNSSLFH
jgi:hypothetical protein